MKVGLALSNIMGLVELFERLEDRQGIVWLAALQTHAGLEGILFAGEPGLLDQLLLLPSVVLDRLGAACE